MPTALISERARWSCDASKPAQVALSQILGALRGMSVRVDESWQYDMTPKIHDVGSRPNEDFRVCIGTYKDDGVTADGKRLHDTVIRIHCVDPAMKQGEISRSRPGSRGDTRE